MGVARTALSAGTQGAYVLLCSGNPMGSITQLHINTWCFSYFFTPPPPAPVLSRVPSETKGLHLNTWLNGSSEKGQEILIYSVELMMSWIIYLLGHG